MPDILRKFNSNKVLFNQSSSPPSNRLSLSSHCWFGSISSSGSQSVLGLVRLLVICHSPVSSDESSGYNNTQPPSFLTHLLHFFPTLQYSAIKVSRQFSNLGVFLLPSLRELLRISRFSKFISCIYLFTEFAA